MNVEVTQELVEKYLDLTARAKKKASPFGRLEGVDLERLDDMMGMCDSYASDAKYFMEKGDLVRAFGAINYAHAWLDAAVRIGLLDGHGDDVLFTLPRGE